MTRGYFLRVEMEPERTHWHAQCFSIQESKFVAGIQTIHISSNVNRFFKCKFL